MQSEITETYTRLHIAFDPLVKLLKETEEVWADYQQEEDRDSPWAIGDLLSRLEGITEQIKTAVGLNRVNYSQYPLPLADELSRPLNDLAQVSYHGQAWCKAKQSEILREKAERERLTAEAIQREKDRVAAEIAQKAAYEAETEAMKRRLGLVTV